MCRFCARNSASRLARSFVSGTKYGVPQEVLELHLLDAAVHQRREEVAHVQDPEDLVERAAIDGVARVRRLHHRLEGLLGREVDRECDDVHARHHHVGGLLVAEVEDLGDHLLLLLLDLPEPLRAVEQHAQLRLGVNVPLGARAAPARSRAG